MKSFRFVFFSIGCSNQESQWDRWRHWFWIVISKLKIENILGWVFWHPGSIASVTRLLPVQRQWGLIIMPRLVNINIKLYDLLEGACDARARLIARWPTVAWLWDLNALTALKVWRCLIVWLFPFYGPGYFCPSSKVTDTHWAIQRWELAGIAGQTESLSQVPAHEATIFFIVEISIFFFSITCSICLVENTHNYVRLQFQVWIFHKRKRISVSVFESQPAHCFSHFARLISEYMKKTGALAGSGAAPPSRPLPTAPSSRFLVSLTLDFSLFIAALCKMNNLVQILPCFLETIQGILPSSVYFPFRILDCTVIGSKHGTYLLSCTEQLGRRQNLWIFIRIIISMNSE